MALVAEPGQQVRVALEDREMVVAGGVEVGVLDVGGVGGVVGLGIVHFEGVMRDCWRNEGLGGGGGGGGGFRDGLRDRWRCGSWRIGWKFRWVYIYRR